MNALNTNKRIYSENFKANNKPNEVYCGQARIDLLKYRTIAGKRTLQAQIAPKIFKRRIRSAQP